MYGYPRLETRGAAIVAVLVGGHQTIADEESGGHATNASSAARSGIAENRIAGNVQSNDRKATEVNIEPAGAGIRSSQGIVVGNINAIGYNVGIGFNRNGCARRSTSAANVVDNRNTGPIATGTIDEDGCSKSKTGALHGIAIESDVVQVKGRIGSGLKRPTSSIGRRSERCGSSTTILSEDHIGQSRRPASHVESASTGKTGSFNPVVLKN